MLIKSKTMAEQEIEQLALKAYPVKNRAKGLDPYDENKYDREKWIEGFKAALQSVEGDARPVWVKASEVLPPIGEDNYLKIDNQPFTGIYFKEGYNGIYKDNKSHFNVGGKILL